MVWPPPGLICAELVSRKVVVLLAEFCQGTDEELHTVSEVGSLTEHTAPAALGAETLLLRLESSVLIMHE